MREVFSGNTSIRFDASMGELWDVDEVLREHGQPVPIPQPVNQMGTPLEILVNTDGWEEPPQGWEASEKELEREDKGLVV
jgi:hypothetical protein